MATEKGMFREPYFSNPDIPYKGDEGDEGVPFGIGEGVTDDEGNDISADNHKTLLHTWETAANLRPVPYIPPFDPKTVSRACDDPPASAESLGVVTWELDPPRNDKLCQVRLKKTYSQPSGGIPVIVSTAFCERMQAAGRSQGAMAVVATYSWEATNQQGSGSECTADFVQQERQVGFEGYEFELVEVLGGGQYLPNVSPYVKTVQVTSDSETIYHAGWEQIDELDQLGFVHYSDPIDPTAGSAAQIQIFANEAMQVMSAALPGQSATMLDPCPGHQDGTCWEGPLLLPDLDAYPLTIRGQDLVGNFLLPFADRSPKTLSTHPHSDAGDTAHTLDVPDVLSWWLTLPVDGACQEADGGITCTFGQEAITGSDEQYGSVTLRPSEELQQIESQAVVVASGEQRGKMHDGTYWVPDGGLELVVRSSAEGSAFCEAGSPVTRECDDGPPAPLEQPASLNWSVTTHTSDTENLCHITIQSGEEELVLTMQPSDICATIAQDQGVLSATAQCAWDLVETDYEWMGAEYETVTRTRGWTTHNYIECTSYSRRTQIFYGCQDNPEWQQTPSGWTLDGEPLHPVDGGNPTQLLSVTYSECQDWSERKVSGGCWSHYCPKYVRLDHGGSSTFHAYLEGTFKQCTEERTVISWTGVGKCTYHPLPQALQLMETIRVPLGQ